MQGGLREQVSLAPLTTFAVPARARLFAQLSSQADVEALIADGSVSTAPRLLLGGGSNILLVGDFDGLVLRNGVAGIESIEGAGEVTVVAGGGIQWDALVDHCVQQGWGGVENLSLIPGTVGAAPIQNIGAYGAELADVFLFLDAIDLDSGQLRRFSREECRFTYRTSVFRRPDHANRYCVLRVALRLSLRPRLEISYPSLAAELKGVAVTGLGLAEVRAAVIRVRTRRLPAPSRQGNAGSFFKNPQLSSQQVAELRQDHPTLPAFPGEGASLRIPAGWLIQRAGCGGATHGGAAVSPQHSLVLVNTGNATGQDVVALARTIRAQVVERFGVVLEPEVTIIGAEL